MLQSIYQTELPHDDTPRIIMATPPMIEHQADHVIQISPHMGKPFKVPSPGIPRMSLFPAVGLEDEPTGSEVTGVIMYGIIPGLHTDLLPHDAPVATSLDGFRVLGYRDPILKTSTRGNITVIPLMSVENTMATPMPVPLYPGDTSLLTAAAVATDNSWSGIMPFAITGAVDQVGNIAPNKWSSIKKSYLESYHFPLAGASNDADYVIPNLSELIKFLQNVPDETHGQARPGPSFYTPHKGHTGKTFAADSALDQILAKLTQLDARMDRIESRATTSAERHMEQIFNEANAPVQLVTSRGAEPKAIGWLHTVDSNYPGTFIELDRFATNDPTGRRFHQVLKNSTPMGPVGPTQSMNQASKIQRLYENAKSMGIGHLLTPEWIAQNGHRGPTSEQMKEFKFGRVPAPDPTSMNVAGLSKPLNIPVRINTDAVDKTKAYDITWNALGKEFATKEAIKEVIELMASNGGRGPPPPQIQELVRKYRPAKGTPHVKTLRRENPPASRPVIETVHSQPLPEPQVTHALVPVTTETYIDPVSGLRKTRTLVETKPVLAPATLTLPQGFRKPQRGELD